MLWVADVAHERKFTACNWTEDEATSKEFVIQTILRSISDQIAWSRIYFRVFLKKVAH